MAHRRWTTRLALLLTASVSLGAATSADAARILPGSTIGGAPGEITIRFTEVRLPPNTEVHYRLSVGRVAAVFVSPWQTHTRVLLNGETSTWYWRDSMWSDPTTGDWQIDGWRYEVSYLGTPSCCAGPTWDYTATSDASGTVHGLSTYRWQARPPWRDDWLLSHYSLVGGFIADLDHQPCFNTCASLPSYRETCEPNFTWWAVRRARFSANGPPANPQSEPCPTGRASSIPTPPDEWRSGPTVHD